MDGEVVSAGENSIQKKLKPMTRRLANAYSNGELITQKSTLNK